MRLTFSSDRPSNTNILSPTNETLYTVSSSKFAKSTTITRPSTEPGQDTEIELASIDFHTWETDRIVLRGRSMLVKGWIKRSAVKTHHTFTAASGRAYQWSIHHGAYKLQALESGPVLAERPHVPGLESSLTEMPVLDVSDEEEVIQDLDDIVANFVYVSVRRAKQKMATTAALG